MKLLKLKYCSPTLSEFAKKINIDFTNNYNEFNEILCKFSEKLPLQLNNPKMFFLNYNTIYYFEFLPGKEEVLLGQLNFTKTSDSDEKYIANLISDPHRVWSITSLTYDHNINRELSNQVLTLLRICNINKDDYLKNPNILSKKFK